MILLIDNYDSFVYNLARYFELLGPTTVVRRNDCVDVEMVHELQPDAIVLSPGPCGPAEAGNSLEIVNMFCRRLPILGICLGHQTIAASFGAKIVRADQPMHGRTSLITHDGSGVFADVPPSFQACRYHSLVVDEPSLPKELSVSARTSDGIVMAIRHRDLPIVGVQFHPESILTEYGFQILANFLKCVDIPVDQERSLDQELRQNVEAPKLPQVPVTF